MARESARHQKENMIAIHAWRLGLTEALVRAHDDGECPNLPGIALQAFKNEMVYRRRMLENAGVDVAELSIND